MKKFLQLLDDNILRFGVAFALLFTALYPKLPSINITHTWVYVRLEDFLILALAVIWLIQLVRRKVSLPKPEGYVLVGYWVVGLISLIYCLLVVAPHLANFYPKIAALQYLRRIEYMILFFIAFSSVKKQKDIIIYLMTLGATVFFVTLYGFGQKFYVVLWNFFPAFFKHNPFCFPAFLTGNEEFAKGTPLCLEQTSRISSTFGGHYDLAAYLVFIVPIFIALFIVVKRWYLKGAIALLAILALELLNFTSSRTSFAAYLVGVTGMLIIWRKKWWIIPVLTISMGVLFLFSNSTLQRFAKTVQPVQVLQAQPGASQEIQKIITKTKATQDNKHPSTPPPGTVTVGSSPTTDLASLNLASSSGQVLTDADIESLLQNNIKISTDSGSFLLRKAYALDISFTTRFQAEWPRDWNAFLSSPVLGTGYSSLTLASDNDYLRSLGETGLAGLLAFLSIFVVLGIFMRRIVGSIQDPVTRAFLYGLVGGIIGLLINAFLIDVFEASKVAEPLWILLGIGVGVSKLHHKNPIQYKKEIVGFLTSRTMIMIYLLMIIATVFIASIGNFFVANDFTWLHWAAMTTPSQLSQYFFHSQNLFYRPLDKTIVYFLYSLFSFQPEGYHLFILFLHFLVVGGVYSLAQRLSRNKLIGILTAIVFALHPAHSENIFWFSSISVEISSILIMYTLLAFLHFRERKSLVGYVIAVIFSALALLSYEQAIVIPLLLFTLDFFIIKQKRNRKSLLAYIPFLVLAILYFMVRSVAHAFLGSGEYGYHLGSFIPNIFGNFFGYTGLFFCGLPFLSFYTLLRNGLRTEWIYFTIVVLIFVGYVGWSMYIYKKVILKVLQKSETALILFSLVFAFLSLLPFLPLGNIAPHYLYLASFGYALALLVALQMIIRGWIKNRKYVTLGLLLIILILSVVYCINNRQEQQQWQKSGKITKDTLLFFRKKYTGFTTKTNLYFVNTPIKQEGAWIFPAGLSDGLWFIYRNNMPQIHQVDTFDEALTAVSKSDTDSHIFEFDEDGKIREAK